MSGGVLLWLDDERPAPDGWTHVRTYGDAVALLLSTTVVSASLDHDLGDVGTAREMTGYDFVLFMAENDRWPVTKPIVHSANAVGANNMRSVIDRYWSSPEGKE